MDRWNIVTSLNYLAHDKETDIVHAKAPGYEGADDARKSPHGAVADLTRSAFINGDISTVMSPHGFDLGRKCRNSRR